MSLDKEAGADHADRASGWRALGKGKSRSYLHFDKTIPVAVWGTDVSGAGVDGKPSEAKKFPFCSIESGESLIGRQVTSHHHVLCSLSILANWKHFLQMDTFLSPTRSSTLPLSYPFNLAFHLSQFSKSASGHLMGHMGSVTLLSHSMYSQNSPNVAVNIAVLFLEEILSF